MSKAKIKGRKSAIETEPETRIINIIHCDQSIAGIMLQLIKMNKNITRMPTKKVNNLIGVDQT